MAADVEVTYKCCKNKQLKTVVCVKCGEAYHTGCQDRAWRDATILTGAKIDCCKYELEEENDNHMVKKIEELYRELIVAKNAEIEAKNQAIKAKDQLINELIAKIDTQKEKIKQPSTITYVEATTAGKSSANIGVTGSSNRNNTTATKGQSVDKPHDARLQNQYITTQQLQLALHEEKTKTTAENLINLEQDGWKQRHKGPVKSNQRPKTLGTANVTNNDFSGAEKKVWLYLYRIKNNATAQKITDYILKQESFKNEKVMVKEIPGESTKLKRFVVTAPFSKKDELYDPGFWPSGVGIKRFDFGRHREFIQEQSADFL